MGYKQIDLLDPASEKKVGEILSLFRPVEGEKKFYFGRTRNGKTTLATMDILELLNRGEIVVANWMVKWDGYDERKDFWTVFYKMLFGRKYFYHYKKDNFIYVPPNEVRERLVELAKLVNVHYYFDEAQWLFNSAERYDNNDPEARAKMSMILESGHYCRSLNIVSQRPSNVNKNMRSEINVWVRCEKVLSWPWLVFRRTLIEDIDADALPDLESETNVKSLYWPSKKQLEAFDTHAMRSQEAIEKVSDFDVYEASRWSMLGDMIKAVFARKRERGERHNAAATPVKPLLRDRLRIGDEIV